MRRRRQCFTQSIDLLQRDILRLNRELLLASIKGITDVRLNWPNQIEQIDPINHSLSRERKYFLDFLQLLKQFGRISVPNVKYIGDKRSTVLNSTTKYTFHHLQINSACLNVCVKLYLDVSGCILQTYADGGQQTYGEIAQLMEISEDGL